jgi:hypothetical protein
MCQNGPARWLPGEPGSAVWHDPPRAGEAKPGPGCFCDLCMTQGPNVFWDSGSPLGVAPAHSTCVEAVQNERKRARQRSEAARPSPPEVVRFDLDDRTVTYRYPTEGDVRRIIGGEQRTEAAQLAKEPSASLDSGAGKEREPGLAEVTPERLARIREHAESIIDNLGLEAVPRRNEAGPVCEHAEPWRHGCPACDPRCKHGVAVEFACSWCAAEGAYPWRSRESPLSPKAEAACKRAEEAWPELKDAPNAGPAFEDRHRGCSLGWRDGKPWIVRAHARSCPHQDEQYAPAAADRPSEACGHDGCLLPRGHSGQQCDRTADSSGQSKGMPHSEMGHLASIDLDHPQGVCVTVRVPVTERQARRLSALMGTTGNNIWVTFPETESSSAGPETDMKSVSQEKKR